MTENRGFSPHGGFSSHGGFSLLELMVSLGIMGLLIGVLSFQGTFTRKAEDVKRKGEYFLQAQKAAIALTKDLRRAKEILSYSQSSISLRNPDGGQIDYFLEEDRFYVIERKGKHLKNVVASGISDVRFMLFGPWRNKFVSFKVTAGLEENGQAVLQSSVLLRNCL